jgi:tetratricopeptide (TPR) repeat protein
MLEAFDKAVALDPDEYNEDVQKHRFKLWADSYNSGVKYYQRGRDTASYFKVAIDSLKLAILALPESTRTYYVCALAYYGDNQVEEAIKSLDKSLEKDPKNMDQLKLLGRMHAQLAREKADAKDNAASKKEYAAAVAAFEKVYGLDSMDTDNALSLIDMYERAGQGEKVFTMTRNAVNRNPDNVSFRYIFGVYLIKQDRFGDGIEHLTKVVQANPESAGPIYADAVYNLGVAYLNWGVALKKAVDAREDSLRKLKKKDIKEDVSYKDKFKAAVPYFEKAAEMKKDDPALWQQLGRLYANLNMKEKADEAFKRFDELNK